MPDGVLEAALAAARERTGLDGAELTVVRAERVRWRDGSLGCPQPGRHYPQAIVDGYWIVLDASGEELDYRAGRTGVPRLCERGGQPPLPRDDV